MKQFYELKIKPLNDRLGNDLGKKTVQVKHENAAYDVPVKVSFVSQQGSRVIFTNSQIKSYRALGLRI